ncbi:MAG: CopG family transcriptional regulator [Nitrospinae bacterium]|nr:CopG family transcriptional regulator [Nitrospinota bacterium]
MQSVHIKIPDALAAELDALVRAGWFRSKNELICLALVEFARHHRVALAEQFQQEDIAWALRQLEPTQE